MMDKLLEYNNYSTGTKILFLVFLLIAPLVNFVGLWYQHDFIVVLLELICLGYALPTYIMHKFIDEKIAVKLAAKDVGDPEEAKGKAKAALIYGAIIGAIIGAGLIIWSKFSPWGPASITLEMPLFTSKGKEVAYWICWSLLWVLVLPVAEVTFYFMFQACVWNQAGSDFLIAGLYGLMNWCWIYFVVGGYWWSIGLAGASFGLGYFLLKHRDNKGGIEVMGLRVGIAIGLLALLVFLNFEYPRVKVPTWYFRGDARNIWNKH